MHELANTEAVPVNYFNICRDRTSCVQQPQVMKTSVLLLMNWQTLQSVVGIYQFQILDRTATRNYFSIYICLLELIFGFKSLFQHVWCWSGKSIARDAVIAALTLQHDASYDVRMALWYDLVDFFAFIITFIICIWLPQKIIFCRTSGFIALVLHVDTLVAIIGRFKYSKKDAGAAGWSVSTFWCRSCCPWTH